MTKTTSHGDSAPTHSVLIFKRYKSLVILLESQKIDFSEFAYNFVCRMIEDDPEYWDQCLRLVPSDYKDQFTDFVHDYLEPVDFKPCPRIFMAPPFTEDAVEEKQVEMRPKYVNLFRMVCEE